MINAITGLPNRTSHLREDVIIDGTLNINDGTQAAGYVLTSDADGNASWQFNSSASTCSITGGTLSGGTLLLTTTCTGTTYSITGFTSGSGSTGLSTFGYFYQTVADVSGTIAANNGKALFQTAAPDNTAGFTMTPASGDITVASAGKYKISFSVAGVEANAFGVFIGAGVVAGRLFRAWQENLLQRFSERGV